MIEKKASVFKIPALQWLVLSPVLCYPLVRVANDPKNFLPNIQGLLGFQQRSHRYEQMRELYQMD